MQNVPQVPDGAVYDEDIIFAPIMSIEEIDWDLMTPVSVSGIIQKVQQ